MTSRGDEPTVFSMPERRIPAAGLTRPTFRTTPNGQFHPEVAILREWPQRIALVVGTSPQPQVLNALDSLGFQPIITPAPTADRTVREMAPFAFLVLGADVLAAPDSVARIRFWRSYAPSSRVKLMYPGSDRDAEVLVRAIRAGVTDVVDPGDPVALIESLRAGMAGAGAVRERVLAIGAHPDDVEIGCAGTLIDHRRRDDRISILTLSRGAVGGNQHRRLAEAGAAADALGAQLMMADLPDTEIDPGVSTIRLIESVVAAVDPTVVYVHSAHDNHQDHRAVSVATRSATRGVRRVFAYQSPSATNDFRPSQFVNVDETLRHKIEVLSMFASQHARSYLEPELVVAGARYWARHLGANARYAEPFEVIRSVGELRQVAAAPSYPAQGADRATARPGELSPASLTLVQR